jgi:CO/xanthine dehydrogenase FAD-binding subunit
MLNATAAAPVDGTGGSTIAYHRPAALAEALALLAQAPRRVLAGCTDALVGTPALPEGGILDITAIGALRGISVGPGHVRIGALATWSEIAAAGLPGEWAALQAAARQIGGVQIQNAGTLAGNLCNASPAADGVPCLLILDAAVELQSAAGRRLVPLAQFITGPRRTALAPGELLTAILVPRLDRPAASTFLKLGARAYQVISIVMVAASLAADDTGAVAEARIAVGSCSAVAQRLPALEARLKGRPLAELAAGIAVTPADLQPLKPISDIRATAAYRVDAAATLISRALAALAAG